MKTSWCFWLDPCITRRYTPKWNSCFVILTPTGIFQDSVVIRLIRHLIGNDSFVCCAVFLSFFSTCTCTANLAQQNCRMATLEVNQALFIRIVGVRRARFRDDIAALDSDGAKSTRQWWSMWIFRTHGEYNYCQRLEIILSDDCLGPDSRFLLFFFWVLAYLGNKYICIMTERLTML